MSTDARQQPASGGSGVELALAIVVCAVAMLGPVIYIQYRYDEFVSEYGAIKEGAAGATLVLAVILRTVSRTLLRTVVRASARAGIKAGMKGALQTVLRLASRVLFSQFSKFLFGKSISADGARSTDPAEIRKSNVKSLFLGSALIYASWVIVVGLGQPFTELMSTEQAAQADAAQIAEQEELQAALRSHTPPEVTAWERGQELHDASTQLNDLRAKMEKATPSQVEALRKQLVLANASVGVANAEFAEALAKAKGRIMPPEADAEEVEPVVTNAAIDFLFTRAPFPGETDWSSPTIWLGGVFAFLPLWFIYVVQSNASKGQGVPLYHETGVDGGVIQLYFAGAFSFMPLTSDVIVAGTAEQKGKVSLMGLLAPTAVSVVLWLAWKMAGVSNLVLLASDLFLIYPMVQVFPLSPLDGAQVWRWNKKAWLATFILILSIFMFMGSEGLKHVI